MKRIIFSLFLFFLISNSVFSQCGTCAIPDCNNMIRKTGATADADLKTDLNYQYPTTPPSQAYKFDPDPLDGKTGPFTFDACYEIYVTSTSQTVGIAIKPIYSTPTIGANLPFTGELRKSGDCTASPIAVSNTIPSVSTGGQSIPSISEWTGLAIGTYVYCIKTNVPAGFNLKSVLVGSYVKGGVPSNECSSCAVADCKIAGPYPSFTDATVPTDHCSKKVDISSSPVEAPTAYISYYKVKTSSSATTLGIIVSNRVGNLPGSSSACGAPTRTATLYPIAGCASGGIAGSTTSNTSSFSSLNREWSGLTPNTEYIIKVETTATTDCQIEDQCASYYTPGAVTPIPCGTVGIAWRNSANTPSTSDLNNCRDKNFEIKANSVIIATQDIAPGFSIDNDFGKINLSKIELDQGRTGTYINTQLVKDITFCSPKVDYNVRLTGAISGSGSGIIRIVDHGTGQVLFSGPFITGMVIPINSGMIKGTAVFSGPGVSNYRLNYPTTGSTIYEAAGYGFFNPKTAGNGKHKINYSWNNGNKDCDPAFIEVEVKGCACNPDNGASVIKINGATPSILKNPSPNTYILCYDDIFTINTTGATPSVDYALFTCAPTSNKIDNTTKDACYADAFFENLNSMSETSKGNTSAVISYLASQSKTVTKNTLWWAPVTTATISILSDEACYQMDYQNEAYKVTYLNEIKIDTITDCSNSEFKLKILGGAPEFVSGSTYSLSTDKGKFKSTSLTTATMTSSGGIDYLTGLVSGETFTITITDGVGCTKKVIGKYVCPCSKPTITLNATPTEVCLGATTTSFAYTATTNSPDKYSITWNSAAITDGFVDITDANLSTSPISVNIPSAATAQTYTGSLTVKNSTTGCTSTAQNVSFVINGKPTITPTPNEVCLGATTTSFAYTATTNNPNKYSITWNSAAITDGFVDITDANLSTSPISVNIPSAATAQTYTGSLTVKNSTTGCTSTAQNVSFVINGKPTITPTPNEVCLGATTTSFAYSGITNSPNKYSITWNSAAITDGFSNVVDATLTASPQNITLPAGAVATTYNGSLTVKNSTTGCSSTAQNISFIINPLPKITGVFNCMILGYEVLTASTLPATLNPWATSAPTIASITSVSGHPEQIQVNGVLKGTSDISYTDIKGCKTKEQFTVGFVCDKITYIAGNQTICNGANPNPISVTSSDDTEDVDFVYFPLAQTDTTTIYTGGTTIATVTPISGSGLAAFGTLDLDKIKLLPPNDYFVYAKFKTTPTEKDCRAFKEIKVTIKDTTSPLITIAPTLNLNEYTVTWKDVPAAVSYKVDTVTYVKGNVPTTPNWKSLLPNITANHTLQAPLIFPNIPFGRTLLVQVTPLDVNGVKLSCNSIREKRIDNPSCTKPILEPLNIPDTVCEGASLDLLKGKINASSVKVNFEWYVSTDSLNWTLLSSGGDYLISNTTVNEATDLAIKTKLTMNKSFVRLFGKDVATGQCSDTTLPVKILVNEIPDATISIFPDPAKLCVGDPKSIEVTFQGSKGLQPYRFDFELDAVAKDTASSNIPGDGKVIKTFKTTSPILDSTFVLKKVTDKNGCFADISNQSVKMEVVALPQPIFQADKTIGCYPLEVIFTDKSAVLNTDVEWDFGNGDLDNTSLGVVKYVFQKSGDYTIKFKSTKNGCWDTMQKTNYIHVKDRPVAQFSPKKTNISLIDPEIQFINSSSSNSVYYKWIFGDGSPVSNLVNPKHKYIGEGNNGLPEPGKYLVELYAFINQDCWDSTSTIITIDDEQIFYIPNTFTPNNDERNNTFQPIFTSGFDAQNYHFLIYNRWGELMFESNNSQIGWDGTYGNKLLMNDTYTWKLQFKEKMTEKEHYLTGHVNLIK